MAGDPKAQAQAAQEAAAAAKAAAIAAARAEASAKTPESDGPRAAASEPAGITVSTATVGVPTTGVPLDVFTGAQMTAASRERERGTNDLSGEQQRMADARGAGRLTAEELQALAGVKPGAKTGDDSQLAGTTIADLVGHDRAGHGPGASAGQLRETMDSLKETNSQNQGRMDTSAVASGNLPSIGGTSREDVLGGVFGGGLTSEAPTAPGFGKDMIADGPPDGGTSDGGTPDGGPGGKKGAAWDDEEGLQAGSTDFAKEYPRLSKFLKFFTGDGETKGDALDQAVEVIDAEGKPAPAPSTPAPSTPAPSTPGDPLSEAIAEVAAEAKARAEAAAKAAAEAKAEEEKKKAEEEAKADGSSQPADPDAPTPEEILKWQAYLAANGLLNLNNPNSIENKSQPSPEGAGGGGPKSAGEIWRERQTNESLVGQPVGPDGQDGSGGGGTGPRTNWNDQRIGASNPSPDQNPEYEKGPEDSEAVNLDPNQGDLSHLYGSDDNSDDASSYSRTGRISLITVHSKSDSDDEGGDGGRGD